MSNQIIFSIIYFGVCNWIQIYYLFGNFLKPQRKITTVDGRGLLPSIKKKTGLDVSIKLMSEKKKMIGFMISTPPFKPVMIFSQKLYEILNRDEFEWVALHESGHYLKWHNVKFVFVQFAVYIAGLYLLSALGLITVYAFFLGIILGFIYIQIVRKFEYQADYFAATHMDNPQGMITGNIKMKKVNKSLMAGNSILQRFIIAVSAQDRIKIAEGELVNRKNSGKNIAKSRV